MLQAVVPDPADYPVFATVKTALIRYMNGRVKTIPICVNNCMAFYDCTSAGFSDPEWQTGNDDYCSLCGEDRWLRPSPDAATGTNRKVMYYLPVKYSVKDVFTQADLEPHLWNDTANAAPGSIKASRGYAEKMTNNPAMTGRRDLAFIAQSDGVPYSKDRITRSGCVATLRIANLPEAMHMGRQNRNTHMVGLTLVYMSWCPEK